MTGKSGITDFLEKFVFDLKLSSPDKKYTSIEAFTAGGRETYRYSNEFWTSRQRQASSIHEISYRACFKPQLPRFFIELLTEPGNTVYDPFAGRGTTAIEAALLGRRVIANDINPLSRILTEPRLAIPKITDLENRLKQIPIMNKAERDLDLSMFYHPQTEAELNALRDYLHAKKLSSAEDEIDNWIRMIATNRLTGHSKGFFSVYTMPPNQAVSAERQVKLNIKRNQKPEYRDTRALILKKSRQLVSGLTTEQLTNLRNAATKALFLEQDSAETVHIATSGVDLTVTSPPFLDVVQYARDNWLRCWFNRIDQERISKLITMAACLDEWRAVMSRVLDELYRITKPDGWVAFEVGEVRGGRINLEETVLPLGVKSGFHCAGVIINEQQFTKTSNIWGVTNNRSGTNSNRIVLFNKKITGL